MFNQFVTTIVERVAGQKLPVLLDEFSGTSERTWRNRFKHGWTPTDGERRDFERRTTAALTDKMTGIGGWSLNEAHKILAERPSVKHGAFLPTADLIYQFSPRHGDACQEAIALAVRFDKDCETLAAAVHSDDAGETRTVLISMLDWLLTFCTDDAETEDARVLRSKFDASPDTETLVQAAHPLGEALFLHVLSCWDVEFCASYFSGTMQAYPLFQLVMPRFSLDIEIEPETGRLLRHGRQPRKRIVESATSRLFDFLSTLVAWRRHHRMPDSLPRIKEFAAWSHQDEARIVSWRDETTRLTGRQLEQVWTKALSPDTQGMYPGIPFAMFFCMHLWSRLQVRENGRTTALFDCTADYRLWWDRNRVRLTTKGLQFGDLCLPEYLTAERSGEGILAALFTA